MAGAHARAGRLRNRPRRRLARRQFVPDAYGRKARGGRFGIYLPNSFSNDRRSPRPRRRLLLELLSYDGTDSALGNVILAKAGIQTWRPLRPLPVDSRFRGNDNAGDSVKSRHALARALKPSFETPASPVPQDEGARTGDCRRAPGPPVRRRASSAASVVRIACFLIFQKTFFATTRHLGVAGRLSIGPRPFIQSFMIRNARPILPT